MQTSVFPFVSSPFEPMNLSENISMRLYTENREDLILHVAVLNPRGKSVISLLSCSGEKHSWSLVRTATVGGVSCSPQHFKSQKTSMGLRRAVNEMSSILIEMDFFPPLYFSQICCKFVFHGGVHSDKNLGAAGSSKRSQKKAQSTKLAETLLVSGNSLHHS